MKTYTSPPNSKTKKKEKPSLDDLLKDAFKEFDNDCIHDFRLEIKKLKAGAPFLVYLYYAFDNRPMWFQAAWKVSDLFRSIISRLPFGLKKVVTDGIAASVYFPLAKTALIMEKAGASVDVLPLSTYRNHSFYTMRTDSLDRFGTRLEHRFTRKQIQEMLESAGLERIEFSEGTPYWCAVGFRKHRLIS